MIFDGYTKAELIILKSKLLTDLLFFSRFFFKLLQGSKFIVNDHHKIIANSLTAISEYKYEFLNINIPPRHSKTELAAVNFISWSLARNPRANFLYITASDELRSETSTRIRDIVNSDEFKYLFGVNLKQDQKAKNLWRTDVGGGLKTATILGQITGFGAGRMVDLTLIENEIRTFDGCIVLDDVNKIDDAAQENARNQTVKRVLLNTVPSRRNSTDTPLINIQQRSGFLDATAVLLELYKSNPEKVLNIIMPVVKADGTPLWANKMPLVEIERLKTGRDTWHSFETQYMQNPTRHIGSLFPSANLLRFKKDKAFNESNIFKLAYIDVADAGKDATVCVILYVIETKIYVVDIIYDLSPAPVTMPKCVEKVINHNCNYCFIEVNGLGKAFYRDFKLAIMNRSLTDVREINNSVNKHARIIASSGTINQSCYFLESEDQNEEYILFSESVEKYNQDDQLNPKHIKDSPDALAGGVSCVRKLLRI